MALFVIVMTTAACSKGGNLVLEPGARPSRSSGVPSFVVNQGGHAEIVEQGQTVTTGVHGYISIQPSSTHLSSGSGHSAVINKVTRQ